MHQAVGLHASSIRTRVVQSAMRLCSITKTNSEVAFSSTTSVRHGQSTDALIGRHKFPTKLRNLCQNEPVA